MTIVHKQRVIKPHAYDTSGTCTVCRGSTGAQLDICPLFALTDDELDDIRCGDFALRMKYYLKRMSLTEEHLIRWMREAELHKGANKLMDMFTGTINTWPSDPQRRAEHFLETYFEVPYDVRHARVKAEYVAGNLTYDTAVEWMESLCFEEREQAEARAYEESNR